MPQGAPPEPPPSIILGSFAGVRNNVALERLKEGDLASAVNVDIDDSGQLHRRRGMVRRIAEPCHSLKTIGDVTLVAKSGVLGQLYPDYSFAPLVEVGPAPLCYARVAGTIFFSSAITAGKLVDGVPQPWGSAIEDRWVSPVTRPTETLGQVGGRLLGGVPNATCMEEYKGRLYLACGPLIWATELYLYDYVDRTKNFLPFEDDVTMIAAVSDGLYVGTTTQLLFLQGTFTKGLQITEVLPEAVLPGSMVRVPYAKSMPQARGGQPVPEGYGPMFMTTTGVILGLDGGQAYNLTQDRVVFPGAVRAAALYREDQGLNSYVAALDSAGGPAANARIGDYVDADIVRDFAYVPASQIVSVTSAGFDATMLGDIAFAELVGAGEGDGFGWVDYTDLDAPAPLALPAGIATQITRNLAPTTANNQLRGEFYGHSFWDGTKVVPRAMNDVLVIVFEMKIMPGKTDGSLIFSMIAGNLNIAPYTYSFANDAGELESLRIEVRIACRTQFLANGGQVFIEPSVPCTLYEFSPEFYPESAG